MAITAPAGAPKPAVRLVLAPDQAAPPVPCETCGYTSLHVARLVGGEGDLLGTVLICTNCQAQGPVPAPRKGS